MFACGSWTKIIETNYRKMSLIPGYFLLYTSLWCSLSSHLSPAASACLHQLGPLHAPQRDGILPPEEAFPVQERELRHCVSEDKRFVSSVWCSNGKTCWLFSALSSKVDMLGNCKQVVTGDSFIFVSLATKAALCHRVGLLWQCVGWYWNSSGFLIYLTDTASWLCNCIPLFFFSLLKWFHF